MLKRHKTTLAVFAALATLSFFVQADRTEPTSQPNAQAPIEAPKIDAPLSLVAALTVRAQLPALVRDPFARESHKMQPAARRVAPPAARRVAPASATGPAAPANPYRFAGEVGQSGSARRFLVLRNDIFEVNSGDVLDGGYRVEAVKEREVLLLHLASGVRETLAAEAAPATPAPAAAPSGAPSLLLGAPGTRIPPLREG